MGSCISKCSRKRKREEESVTVQDKLVITQAPLTMNLPPKISTKQNVVHSLSPPSSSSTSSDSSFSCTTRTNTSDPCSIASTLSSSSSCLSSTLSSKERSFSNEFLWACVKENPQIIYTDLAKGSLQKPVPTKAPQAKKLGTSTAQKRARASSPTLSRQKSLRREHTTERPNSPSYYLPNRALRSPSPSRRFTNSTAKESCSRSTTTSAISRASPKGVNLRQPSPSKSNFSKELRPCLVNREMSSAYRNINGEEVVSKQDMEDIDNPLIALDCFIFL